METRLHKSILNQITAQAHLIAEVHDEKINSIVLACDLDIISDKKCEFSFNPPRYGHYDILLFCGHRSILSPRPSIYVVDVSKFKLVHSFTSEKFLTSLNRKVSFIFDLVGAPSNFLKAHINCPDKKNVDMLLYGEEKAEKIGQLRCDFIAVQIGIHTLSAYYGEFTFDKCPLTFEVYNAARLTVVSTTPSLSTRFTVQDSLTITYDCSNCGPGLLDVVTVVHYNSGQTITIPTDTTIPDKHGIVTCIIKLSVAGKYQINAIYNNDLVEESSLQLIVHPPDVKTVARIRSKSKDKKKGNLSKQNNDDDKVAPRKPLQKKQTPSTTETNKNEPSPTPSNINTLASCPEQLTTRPIVSGQGLIHAVTGKVAIFTVDPMDESGKLTIEVQGPRSLARCVIRPEPGSSFYNVEYYPNEIGLYIITVLWDNNLIPGSPFNVTVTDPSMIRCVNYPNIFSEPLVIIHDKTAQLDFDYSKAGLGQLTAFIKKGKDKINLKCCNNPTKKIWSVFIDSSSNEVFRVEFLWNDQPLGEGFTEFRIDGDVTDAPKCDANDTGLQVILKGHGIKEAWVSQPAQFIVNTNNAGKGHLHIDLHRADNIIDIIPVNIESLVDGKFRCSYTVNIPGDYLLTICWGNKKLQGSPFSVKVHGNHWTENGSDQEDGLFFGLVGEELNIIINTDMPLEDIDLMSATCIGEQGQTIICRLVRNSPIEHNVSFYATEPGRYHLHVLYNNIPIANTPFTIQIVDRQEIDNIIVTGPGLKSSALLNEVDSRFTIDATNAGSGKLTVKVKGPQESFRVEIQKNVENERLIQCSYNPVMGGEYVITIFWNGFLTCGSPFHVLLC